MLKYKLHTIYRIIRNSNLFKNSFWGITANLLQNILYSVFFIVIARKYSTEEFSSYILANSLYAFIVAFSSMGLGQWFIRELLTVNDKVELVTKFFKFQFIIGILFYCLNILLVFIIYENSLIRYLALIIGTNIIFDNIIYVITFTNIAQQEQKKNFIVFTIEAVLKFLAAAFLFISTIPIIYLAFILILLRLISLYIFINTVNIKIYSFALISSVKINWNELLNIIKINWPFVVIGSISVIYWRIGIFLVSKNLLPFDVANYEISYKLFSIAQILPYIVSTTLFPKLIKLYQSDSTDTIVYFKNAFIGYTLYGFFVCSFVFTFADGLIPTIFGNKYSSGSYYCKEMFLTILVFPTVLLQANLLVSMKLEKMDMQLNILSLFLNILFCTVGLQYFKTLSVVNISVFISFFIFHVFQDIMLYRLKIISKLHIYLFYLSISLFILWYRYISMIHFKEIVFVIFWITIFSMFLLLYFRKNYLISKLLFSYKQIQ